MDIKELRLGNYVKDTENGISMCVVAIFSDGTVHLDFEGSGGDVWECEAKDLVGIELDEYRLLKCGFEKRNNEVNMVHDEYAEWYQKEYPPIGIICQSADKKYLFDEETDTIRIYSLHQFQNLIYSLTGKELTIKQ